MLFAMFKYGEFYNFFFLLPEFSDTSGLSGTIGVDVGHKRRFIFLLDIDKGEGDPLL